MAARSTFASLIAGLQVAITQPIRIDDAVVVEGEWAWIEENRIHLYRNAIVGFAEADRSADLFY
jgi:small-conductance mechanosensitive channel